MAPGLTDTKLMQNSTRTRDQIDKFINELSIKRLGRAEEIAKFDSLFII